MTRLSDEEIERRATEYARGIWTRCDDRTIARKAYAAALRSLQPQPTLEDMVKPYLMNDVFYHEGDAVVEVRDALTAFGKAARDPQVQEAIKREKGDG